MSNQRNLARLGKRSAEHEAEQFVDLLFERLGSPLPPPETIKAIILEEAERQGNHLKESQLFKSGFVKLYKDRFINEALECCINFDTRGWEIGADCPPGVLVRGDDGEIKITPYGLGIMGADLCLKEKNNEEDAATHYFLEKVNHFRNSLLEMGHDQERADTLSGIMKNSGLMKLKERFHASAGLSGEA